MSELIEKVIRIARQAGCEVMAIYARNFEVKEKSDSSPLTEADLASHHIISEGLKSTGWPVLSEESADIPFEERRSWGRYWLVDPLDGTKEFVKKTGEFTVNIALIENGFPILGVVYAPAIKRLYYAEAGAGAFADIDGKPSKISISRFDEGEVRVVASKSHRGEKLDGFLEKIGEHREVSMGSSLKFCLVAEGSADLYPRLGPTMEWDTAAAQCVVEEAGGRVTDLLGKRLSYNKQDLHNPEFMVSGIFPWQEISWAG